METNRLRQLRTRKKMSQKALADAVGTSQQQIQRIESGQTVRHQMALDLCAVLGCTMSALFPRARKALKRIEEQRPRVFGDLEDDVVEAASDGGVELDPRDYFVKVHLRSGLERVYSVARKEAERLARYLDRFGWNDDDERHDIFFEFDSDDAQVVIARTELRYVHFLFECGGVAEGGDNASGDEPEDTEIRVYFKDSTEPVVFHSYPDPPRSELDEEFGQLGEFLYGLVQTARPHHFRGFEDVDGETVSLNVGSLAVVEVPHYLVDPPDEDDDPVPGRLRLVTAPTATE
jgi:transcriptional regulator with XRE-family HTH domain